MFPSGTAPTSGRLTGLSPRIQKLNAGSNPRPQRISDRSRRTPKPEEDELVGQPGERVVAHLLLDERVLVQHLQAAPDVVEAVLAPPHLE